MKTYAAMGSNGPVHLASLRAVNYDRVLVSFAYDKKAEWLGQLGYPLTGMLDSGAFTVAAQGIEVDLDAYIAWAQKYAETQPDVRVTNLDVIPGRPGDLPKKRERTKAMRQSGANADKIRAEGLRVIEVHHLFDLPENLDRIFETRKPGEVIGIAGLGGAGANAKIGRAFGDACFARLRDLNEGWENFPPVHGFGVSTGAVGFRYPLASIDASTWVAPHRFGTSYDRGKPLDGAMQKRGGAEAKQLRVREVATMNQARILTDWRTRETAIAAYWAERGVTIESEGAARVG